MAMNNDWRGRFRTLTKRSQFVEYAKIEAFIESELKQAVVDTLKKVLQELRLPTQRPKRYNEYDAMMDKFRNEGIMEYQQEVLRRISDIKKEYGI